MNTVRLDCATQFAVCDLFCQLWTTKIPVQHQLHIFSLIFSFLCKLSSTQCSCGCETPILYVTVKVDVKKNRYTQVYKTLLHFKSTKFYITLSFWSEFQSTKFYIFFQRVFFSGLSFWCFLQRPQAPILKRNAVKKSFATGYVQIFSKSCLRNLSKSSSLKEYSSAGCFPTFSEK